MNETCIILNILQSSKIADNTWFQCKHTTLILVRHSKVNFELKKVCASSYKLNAKATKQVSK